VEETEKRIERVLGPYIRAHGRGSDPKQELRALRVEFGEELTAKIITLALRVVHKHIELDGIRRFLASAPKEPKRWRILLKGKSVPVRPRKESAAKRRLREIAEQVRLAGPRKWPP
jgi:hypothetical protein